MAAFDVVNGLLGVLLLLLLQLVLVESSSLVLVN